MNKNEKNAKINELKDDFERIQEEHKDLDVSKYIANIDDLPQLDNIVIYDYEKDITKSLDIATEILDSLVDMYLGDNPEFKKHRYIQNKMKEDASVYAETLFLSRMTRKNLLTQLKQIDSGDSSARIHEIVNQTFREMRENSKYQSIQRTELEKFYRDFRKDFGLRDLAESNEIVNAEEEESNLTSMDNKSFNDLIDSYIKDKKG